jgi:DNA-binding CsgD family transcriptional regulator/PAS domain-containing protein
MHDFGEGHPDWFYHELRWWLEHRKGIAPILISAEQHGPRYIPDLIHNQWPRTQLIQVSPSAWRGSRPPTPTQERSAENSITAILSGIAISAGDTHIARPPGPWGLIGMLPAPEVYAWEKDRAYRYINVNENYARAAGFDSPHAMLGKKDEDMPWRSLVNLFREGDWQVMSGAAGTRVWVKEKEIMVDRVADILVTEKPLRDRLGKIIGLTGCFIDVSGLEVRERTFDPHVPAPDVPLGEEFGSERFTSLEVEVFRCLVQGWPKGRIVDTLGAHCGAVEATIRSIMQKLQCPNEGDIVVAAVRAGLPLALFGPMIRK